MHTEVIAEIYAAQGALLNTHVSNVQPIISNYLLLLEKAGKEIFTNMKLSAETEKALAQNFIPDDVYIDEVYNNIEVSNRRTKKNLFCTRANTAVLFPSTPYEGVLFTFIGKL
jgi:hypothetical protein